MTWVQNLILVAIILTGFNVLVYIVSGPKYFALGLVFLITRLPRGHWTTCKVYHLDPPGPWGGICDRVCGIPHAYKACLKRAGAS